MNRRQILLAARTLATHPLPHADPLAPTPESLQADLMYLTKLMLAAENLRWRRRGVIRELARVEAQVINSLRDDDQDRPMARRRQRTLFVQQQKIFRRKRRP